MASEPFAGFPHPVAAKATLKGDATAKGKTEEDKVGSEPLLQPVEKSKGTKLPHISKKRRLQSLGILNVASGLDGCDDQLLPSSFRALEVELRFHPAMLGQISLVQTLCLSLASPFWGILSDKSSRKLILAFGTLTWGLATIGLAWVSDLWQVMILRAVNGLSLGCIGPISQSILADTTPESSLGFAFGIIQLSSCIGRLVGGVVTTSVAFLSIGTILGWRICFMTVGGLSVVLAAVVLIFMKEVPRSKKLKVLVNAGEAEAAAKPKSYFQIAKEFLRANLLIPSVVIIAIEGLLGTIPWSAFSFNTMYFQYCGMSDVQAAVITAALLVGAALGGLIGGKMGDLMYGWSVAHGRPLIGQIAVFGRVPLVILAYTIIPKESSYFPAYCFIAFFVGLSSIAGIAVNRPILADVVRPDQRGTVFSIVVAAEGCVSAILGAPLVGILAEFLFGYKATAVSIEKMELGIRVANANALAQALIYQTAIPWVLSFFLYGFLHFTYGNDQKAMKRVIEEEFEAVEESESSNDE